MKRDWRRPLLYCLVAVISFFLIAPTLIVIPMSFSKGGSLHFPPMGFSFRWYDAFFSSSMWTDATKTSLKVAATTVAISTPLGTLTAFGLVRGRFRLRWLVNAIVLSPAIVPIVILAIGMYFVFLKWGLVGSFMGLVLAHTVLALPLVVVTVAGSIQGLDRSLERAAQSLGAGPIRTFWRIILPLILPGVLAGALFAFITSWDEVVAAIFLTSPTLRTLPVVMWMQVRTQLEPTLAVAGTLLMGVTAILLLLGVLLRRRAFSWR